MIRVKDEFDILPELSKLVDGFVKVERWEEHDIDIQPCHNDSIEESNILTIFINSEPDREQANAGTFDNVRKMRPNNIFLVCDIDNQNWPFSTIFYPSFLKETLRINEDFIHTTGEKVFLADALLGGMSNEKTNYRNNIVRELEKQGLVEECLVSLHARDKKQEERSEYRSPALDWLDNLDFIDKATQSGMFNTMIPNEDCGFAQLRYLSQVIPRQVYDSTYVSLVAETETNYGGYYVSEKISKPLISGKPFLVFGAPGYLQALQDIGFKTFNSWWSEAYDNIEDSYKRIQAIVGSLNSFNVLPLKTKINYIEEMKTVTKHNREVCRSDKFIIAVGNEIKRRLDEQ